MTVPGWASAMISSVSAARSARICSSSQSTFSSPVSLSGFLSLEQWAVGIGLGIDQREGNFGHAQGFTLPGSGEDDVFHLGSAERLGRLFAQNPAHRVEDVRFAAAIGTHHHGDSLAGQSHLRAIAERLEPQHLDLFKLQHGRVPLALEMTLAGELPRSNMGTPTCCG